jgi:hypothetical protein
VTAFALRFAEGDAAVLTHARNSNGEKRVGTTVKVKHVGPFDGGDERIQLREGVWLEFRSDYVIEHADGTLGAVDDWQLEPAEGDAP